MAIPHHRVQISQVCKTLAQSVGPLGYDAYCILLSIESWLKMLFTSSVTNRCVCVTV